MSAVNYVYQVKLQRTLQGNNTLILSSIIVDVWSLPGNPSKEEIGREAEKNLSMDPSKPNHGFRWVKVRKKK